MIDLALLRVIKYQAEFNKVSRYIPVSAIDKRTKAITEDIRKYFEMAPEEEVLDFPSFRSMFFTTWHKGLKDEDCDYYNKVISNMEQDVPTEVKKHLINSLLELELVTDVANVAERYNRGEDMFAMDELEELVTTAKSNMDRATDQSYSTFDDDVTVDELSPDQGLQWPIECMNTTYRRIWPGDQYIVAARPGKGKTTFLTHLNYAMAQDMDEGKAVIWFNNESKRQRIMQRQIQSALGLTNNELRELQQKGELKDAYINAMGSADRVRVYDIHGKDIRYLEEILATVGTGKVGAIIFDMLDNVRLQTTKDVREDQRLEKLYQRSRELGVEYDCPVFATSQISNEGANLMFPTENMLKDSKTGKQGACDGIIMIGSSDDPLQANYRGMSMPKSKSRREGQADLREEVLFDQDRGRYK
jgi:replicative DNA helicase